MSKVVLGLSGGVDSSVAAELLKEAGHEVYGLYLENGTPEGAAHAKAAADSSGIPLQIREIRPQLEELVCQPFAEAYLQGQTPNPCVLCNPLVKLEQLRLYAEEIGARYIATGHYARKGEDGLLRMGRPVSDQSYMLSRITIPQLTRLLLPLGEYEKSEVRALAEERKLPAAQLPDSMEICFIPDDDYIAWLSARAELPGPGEYWYHGKCIGTHQGFHRCTVGQHRNLGVSAGKKVFVSEIQPESNRVILADAEELMKTRVQIRDCHWLVQEEVLFRASVRVRHTRRPPTPCTVTLTRGGGAEILCDEPVRAPAPGQTAALYGDGGVLLGSGFITSSYGSPDAEQQSGK